MVNVVGNAFVAGIMALTLSGGASALTLEDHVRSIKAQGTTAIVPAFDTLAARSADLDRSTRALCDAPTPQTLAAARAGFGSALDAWMRVEHLAFGPTVLFMRDNRFSFWPDPRNTTSRQLNQMLTERQDQAITPEAFAHGSIAVQGLPALERLLFEDTGTPLAAGSGTDEGAAAAFRCRFATAITANLSGMAADLDREWRAYVPRLAALTGGPYESPRHASAELFKSFSNQLQRIADLKLGKPLGPSADKANPRLLENWRSDHALSNIVANLEALRELYAGDGFHALAIKSGTDPEIDDLMTTGLDAALATARGIQAPLAGALSDTSQRAMVERLKLQVATLQSLAGGRLRAALDIPFGFNSMDGD
jgi:predicted lipoprotein